MLNIILAVIIAIFCFLIFKNRTTNQWNHVKVEYVGYEGIFDLDLLKDEILE